MWKMGNLVYNHKHLSLINYYILEDWNTSSCLSWNSFLRCIKILFTGKPTVEFQEILLKLTLHQNILDKVFILWIFSFNIFIATGQKVKEHFYCDDKIHEVCLGEKFYRNLRRVPERGRCRVTNQPGKLRGSPLRSRAVTS